MKDFIEGEIKRLATIKSVVESKIVQFKKVHEEETKKLVEITGGLKALEQLLKGVKEKENEKENPESK